MEARKAYEKLLSSFADQSEPAREARIRLTKLNPASVARTELSARRLTRPLTTFEISTISRDGRYAAYVGRQQSVPKLLDLVAGTERELGTPGRRLVPVEEFSHSAAISPDGSQVAYNHCRGNRCELRIIGVKASEPKVLARGIHTFFIADWSRDGSALLLREIYGTDGRWLMVNARTGHTKTLALPAPQGLGNVLPERRYAQARFSPDTRWIAFTSTESSKARTSRVMITSVDGLSRTPVTEEGADSYVFGWSARGDRLFFVSDQAGTQDLWVAPIQNGKLAGVPTISRKDFGVVLGAGTLDDGRLYYSVVSNAGDAWIGELDIAGAAIRGLRRISQPRGALTSYASFSPDGKRLLVNRLIPPSFGSAAMVHEIDSGDEREVKPPAEHVKLRTTADGARIPLYQACWAPDGRSLCFGIIGDGPWTLVVSDPDSGELKAKIEGEGLIYNWPVVLRDGKHAIAARSGNLSTVSPVVLLNLESGEEREICRCVPRGQAVSPDGRQILCAGIDGVIRTYSIDGKAQRELVKGRDLGPLTWTPDGKHVIYTSAGAYWILPSTGGAPRRITLPVERYGRLDIHPNGRQIAISFFGASAELWVLENFATAVR